MKNIISKIIISLTNINVIIGPYFFLKITNIKLALHHEFTKLLQIYTQELNHEGQTSTRRHDRNQQLVGWSPQHPRRNLLQETWSDSGSLLKAGTGERQLSSTSDGAIGRDRGHH